MVNDFLEKVRYSIRWLPAYGWQRCVRHPRRTGLVHLIIALADHFEPSILPGTNGARAQRSEQEQRLEKWCREYPKVVKDWPDNDGRLFCHTYFYPAEQYDKSLIERLADHCRAGWGEIEIHLHHGIDAPDSSDNTRRQLVEFRDALVRHGCLSRMDGTGPPRYGFVHGNWALANSAGGLWCGVDDEMQILADTGCYADFTLPAAPAPAQIGKINALYECSLPLDRRAPHRRGRDLRCGLAPKIFPLIVQGPLALDFRWRRKGWSVPVIENGEITTLHRPTMGRLKLWQDAAVTVRGRPDWLFIKLHCHGMDPGDDEAMLGTLMRQFLRDLVKGAKNAPRCQLHFVTAREMVNMILAACDGREGNPGNYRDYRLQLMSSRAEKTQADSAVQTEEVSRKS